MMMLGSAKLVMLQGDFGKAFYTAVDPQAARAAQGSVKRIKECLEVAR